jgi:PhnB protein
MNTSSPMTLIPHLSCRDAADAIDFYGRSFDAEAVRVFRFPDGSLMHAEMAIGDAMFFVGEAAPEHGCPGPLEIGGSPVTLHLRVADCDASFLRALAQGCQSQMEPADMFWGDRYAVVVDPFGHRWSLAAWVREVPPEEIARAGAEFCGKV